VTEMAAKLLRWADSGMAAFGREFEIADIGSDIPRPERTWSVPSRWCDRSGCRTSVISSLAQQTCASLGIGN